MKEIAFGDITNKAELGDTVELAKQKQVVEQRDALKQKYEPEKPEETKA